MDKIINDYSLLNQIDVSRETLSDFERFISLIIEKNKKINLISRKNLEYKTIRERHIIDSAQAIDFIDLNQNTTCDLGSGAGMPGIIIAIMIKKKKKKMKINLYEKSYHKSNFLREVSKKLNLNTEVIQKDIMSIKKQESCTVISRAFKPLPVMLDIVTKNFTNYKNLILFMGKDGKKILRKTFNDWDFHFEEKKSLTSPESFLLNIKNVKHKKK